MDARDVQPPPLMIGEFVNIVLNSIITFQECHDYDLLVRVESGIAFNALEKYLRQLASVKTELTPEILGVFCQFLLERWQRIQTTDAIYPHAPYSKANKAYFVLAEYLGELLGKHPYDLLMPMTGPVPEHTLAVWHELALHEFILRDNGAPLPIMNAFALIANNAVPPVGLTMEEKLLVGRHSEVAHKYYIALQLEKHKIPDSKNNLLAALHSHHEDNPYKVTASYGEAGKLRLVRIILNAIAARADINTREKFIACMAATIRDAEWANFLAYISDEDFYRMMLHINTEELSQKYPNAVQYKKELVNVVEDRLNGLLESSAFSELKSILDSRLGNKAACIRTYSYCLIKLYQRMRAAQPENKSSLASVVAYFGSPCYSRKDKVDACNAFGELIQAYTNLNDLITAVEAGRLGEHRKPLFADSLGKLAQIILDVVKKGVEQLDQPRKAERWRF